MIYHNSSILCKIKYDYNPLDLIIYLQCRHCHNYIFNRIKNYSNHENYAYCYTCKDITLYPLEDSYYSFNPNAVHTAHVELEEVKYITI